MAHEVLLYTSLETTTLVAVGYIGWLWRAVKEARHHRDGTPIEDLEIDHIIPKHRGGTDTRENLRAVTLVEHAQKHHREALRASNPSDRHKEHSAVGSIVSRMTPEEYQEFIKTLKK